MISSMASRASDRDAAMVSIPTGPPPKLTAMHGEVAVVEGIEAAIVHLQLAQRLVGLGPVDARYAVDRGVISDPAQEPVGDAGGAARAPRYLAGRIVGQVDVEDGGGATDDDCQLGGGVEVEAVHGTEAVAEGRADHGITRGGADEGEAGHEEADGAGAGALPITR